MNVAIIPARGGSSRIPRKNIRLFHGKPIIAYSIEAAKMSGLFEQIIVSTDDEEIAGVAESCDAEVLDRPPELALDEVGTQEVMREDLKWINPAPDYACCIYATAPMLRAFDLAAGLALLDGHPFAYVPGIYYWGQTEAFLSDVPLSSGLEVPYPQERYIDINTSEDWAKAENMYGALKVVA